MPRLILTCDALPHALREATTDAAARALSRERLPAALKDADGGTWAAVRPLTLGVDPNYADLDAVATPRIALVEAPGDMDAPAWLPGARAHVEAAIDAAERAHAEASLMLWPHADGAISDAPSLRTALRTRGVAAGGRWRFIYDPAAMTTPAMVANAEDHLSRWREVLLTHPDLAAVVVRVGVKVGVQVEGDRAAMDPFVRQVLASLDGLDPSVPLIVADGPDRAWHVQVLASAGLA